MKKFIIVLALAISGAFWTGAKVTLPSFISDNMVLQQNTEAALWGWTDSGRKVTVTTSWTSGKFVISPDRDGKWMVKIPTPSAGGPYSISFTDGEAVTISNILIGEVWFCSGQSNMQMPVGGFESQPVEGSADVIMGASKKTPIRMCTIRHRYSLKPLQDAEDSWQENTPEAVAGTSAAAYFFAQKLQQVLGVPVGLLIAEWGGATIEPWISREVLESKFPGEFDLSFLDRQERPKEIPHDQHIPTALFNGQVAPLIPFTFKGMLWYQGESNRGRNEQYTRLQKEYVAMMRDLFKNPDAPFYFVQIAPYPYDNPDKWDSGYFCEAQEKSLDVIPRSGMVTTLDVGEYGTIHPCRKQEVGYRLAYLALVNDYGQKGINPAAPRYESVRFEGDKAFVTFKVDDMGLAPFGTHLDGFEVAGEDRVFHKGFGLVYGKTVEVRSEEVEKPVAVRYCFRNWGVGTLFNCYGIPAGPFRTDGWDL
ncbi:MAG: sialate O-acetylesterase [Bacteroidales bacterium]|nr:sialate O-acetylesterase [Bacteroidales bacterium]